jgi:hypothetical protein
LANKPDPKGQLDKSFGESMWFVLPNLGGRPISLLKKMMIERKRVSRKTARSQRHTRRRKAKAMVQPKVQQAKQC